MQVESIVMRYGDGLVMVNHRDNAGRDGVTCLVIDELPAEAAAHVQAVVDLAISRLPAEPESPELTEIEMEIQELEYRLTQLRRVVAGVATPEEVTAILGTAPLPVQGGGAVQTGAVEGT